jgi:hypothetical protein
VNDASGVGLPHRVQRFQHNSAGAPIREATDLRQLLGEILAVQVLHHHVASPVPEHAHIEHSNHMVTMDLGGSSSLAAKSFGSFRVVCHALEQELDCDGLVEFQMMGCHDNAHAPFTDDAFDTVLIGEGLADGDGTVCHGTEDSGGMLGSRARGG